MPSPSKQKGSGFEREVAKFLTERYGSTFTRSPGSGAYTGGLNSHRRTTLANNQVRSFKGDIMPPEDFELLNCEAKFYAEFPFHQLVDNCSQLESWLQQLMVAADDGDLNILFFKVNRKGRYVAVQANLPWNDGCNHFNYHSDKHGDWMIYSFEKFFELNSEIFKNLSKLKSKSVPKLLLETNI
jgi:hypothetical protein